MGAELRIESELDRSWANHGEAHRQAVADRESFQSETRHRFGPEVAAKVQRHVDEALGRLLADDFPDLDPAAERRFHELLALERAVLEIESRIEAGNTFFDPYNEHGLLPTLGLSWWGDVLPLLPENPGFMARNSVVKFLAMVTEADQRLPSGDESEATVKDFRERRRELIRFLEKAIGLRESVWCDL
jgi:hypothetical protein